MVRIARAAGGADEDILLGLMRIGHVSGLTPPTDSRARHRWARKTLDRWEAAAPPLVQDEAERIAEWRPSAPPRADAWQERQTATYAARAVGDHWVAIARPGHDWCAATAEGRRDRDRGLWLGCERRYDETDPTALEARGRQLEQQVAAVHAAAEAGVGLVPFCPDPARYEREALARAAELRARAVSLRRS